MEPVAYLAQTTTGGCGPCSFIMVARYFDPGLSLTEEEALKEFGFGDRPRHFALAPCFFHAGKALGFKAQIVKRRAIGTPYRRRIGTPPFHGSAARRVALNKRRASPLGEPRTVEPHPEGVWGRLNNLWITRVAA